MPLKFPTAWIIVLDVLGWPAIHFGVAWIFTRLPIGMFSRESKWLRPRSWEGTLYRYLIGVRSWKTRLPDAAPWLHGFAKRKLRSRQAGYLQRFVSETRRSEAAHWMMLAAGGVFFLWNPPWADVVMVGYALLANLPCIITQRYNRLRLQRLLAQKKRAGY